MATSMFQTGMKKDISRICKIDHVDKNSGKSEKKRQEKIPDALCGKVGVMVLFQKHHFLGISEITRHNIIEV
jgi:hypothetical protein